MSGGGHPDYRTAAGQKTSEYDAAFRRGESAYCDFPAFCNPESEAIAVLSSWTRSRRRWMTIM